MYTAPDRLQLEWLARKKNSKNLPTTATAWVRLKIVKLQRPDQPATSNPELARYELHLT